MNTHEITVLAEQVDKMHERTLTLEAQVAGILKLFAEPKLAELLGHNKWQLDHLVNCTVGVGRHIAHINDRFRRAREAERNEAVDRLVFENRTREMLDSLEPPHGEGGKKNVGSPTITREPNMTALTTDELIAWVNETSSRWQAHLAAHPHVLDLPCDIREGATVRDLLHHIVVVELRYAERLRELPVTPYDQVPKEPVDGLFDIHARAMTLLRQAIAVPGTNWDEDLEFPTRSAGTLKARRRTVIVHMLMHSIRHYAQLGTIARHGGAAPDWFGDYLLMDLIRT